MSLLENKIFGQEIITQAEKFIEKLNGNAISGLSRVRKSSLQFLKENGFPGPKTEAYKFTRLTKAALDFDFSEKAKSPAIPADMISDIRKKHLGANVLIFINGDYYPEYADIVSPASDLKIQLLSDRASLDPLMAQNNDAFAAQNDVFANSGVVVEVAKGKTLAAPIISYYLSVSEDSNVGFVKNFYLANESSQADFVHFHRSVNEGKTFINESKNYVIKADAKISLYNIQDENKESVYVGNTDVYQEKDSTFTSYVFTFGGAMVRNNLNIKVDGESCESNMYGLYLTKGKSHVDNHTVVDHIQPNCNSNEMYKGIIDGESRGVFNGIIYVRQAAQKTNAFQSNRNILLTDTAVVNTKPQLEIWADDVKCSHGCTTGQLDEEAIFYLRARGISKEKAKSMILLASVAEVIEKVKLGWLKVEITDKVVERLHFN